MHRIFIVEDDPIIAKAVQKQVSAWGCDAHCANDLKNVLSEFADFDPQLVLMDISLPFFSGYHWCSEIRKVSKVPIIFISSAADNMNIVMAMNMGGDDFISKPFSLTILDAKIAAFLRRSQQFITDDFQLDELTEATIKKYEFYPDLGRKKIRMLG